MSTICSTRFQSKRTRFNEGYVTVFFTVSIALIMSLFIGMFYSARENAIRMRTVAVADTAMTSIFAEYNKQLWEQYGLVFVDASYMTDSTGMKLYPYQRYLMELREEIPIITANGYWDKDHNFYETDSDSPYQDILDIYEYTQYNNLADGKHRIKNFFGE